MDIESIRTTCCVDNNSGEGAFLHMMEKRTLHGLGGTERTTKRNQALGKDLI